MQRGTPYKGKIIEIKRHYNLIEMSQEDPEVKAWLGMSFKAIGPYFKSKTTASGLSFEEQNLLLPEILGMEPTDKDFRKTVIKFYDEFITQVPKDGIKLQISLRDDNAELSRTNLPINPIDYVKYRHIIEHPEVAGDAYEAARIYGKKFYIVDPDRVTADAVSINTLEDKAMAVYFQFKEDKIKTDQILTMLGVNVRNMTLNDRTLKLKSFAVKDSKLSEFEQKEAFSGFIKIAQDKDLEYKYLVQELIGMQYLRRAGNNILYAESGKVLGEDMEDAVLQLKNAKNSRELNLMRAHYLTKSKSGGKEYLPKEEVTNEQTN